MRQITCATLTALALAFVASSARAQHSADPAPVAAAVASPVAGAPAGIEVMGPEITAFAKARPPGPGEDRHVVHRTLNVRVSVAAPTRVHRLLGAPRLLSLRTADGRDFAESVERPATNFRDSLLSWRWPAARSGGAISQTVSIDDLDRLPAVIEHVAVRVMVEVVSDFDTLSTPIDTGGDFVEIDEGVEVRVRGTPDGPSGVRGVVVAYRLAGTGEQRPVIGRIELVDASGRTAAIAGSATLIETEDEAVGEATEWRSIGSRLDGNATLRLHLIRETKTHEIVLEASEIDLLGG
ncbi:MAG: hypothetical protein AAF356_05595 [Planctomycetota bacterium]